MYNKLTESFMDNHSAEQRHKNMQAIKSKDTSIELLLRKKLWKEGIRYRKNYNKICGKPDIAITKYKIAVFCDSEFWHGKDFKKSTERIGTNSAYWQLKIKTNMERDLTVTDTLTKNGWIVLRFWGKDIVRNTDDCINKIKATIEGIKRK